MQCDYYWQYRSASGEACYDNIFTSATHSRIYCAIHNTFTEWNRYPVDIYVPSSFLLKDIYNLCKQAVNPNYGRKRYGTVQ